MHLHDNYSKFLSLQLLDAVKYLHLFQVALRSLLLGHQIIYNRRPRSTHPEALAKFVLETKAQVGVAFDGDGDRCIAVDELGNIIDGDQHSITSRVEI